jgi:hypothetical protein
LIAYISKTRGKDRAFKRRRRTKESEHHMKTRVAAVVAAVIIGVTAPASSVMAFDPNARPTTPSDVSFTGSLGVHDSAAHTACPMSSAAEGNANQQNFPVKQYGQTSGGTRC